MPITEAAKAHLAKLAEQGAQAKPQAKKVTKKVAKKVEEAPVEAPAADAEETPAEGE